MPENHQSLSLKDLAHFGHFSFCFMVAFQMVIRCRFPGVSVCVHVFIHVCEYTCVSEYAYEHMCVSTCV